MLAVSDYLGAGLEYHQAGQLSQAEQIYRKILTSHPNCAEAWYLLGLLAHQLAQNELALEYLQHAATLDDARDIFHASLGLIYRQMGLWEEAAASYSRAVQLNPAEAENHFYLGLALDQLGQLEVAANSFDQALQIQPGLVQAQYNRGVVLEKLDRLDEAAACYQRTLQRQPDHAEAYHNLGNIYRKVGSFDQAIICYLKSLQFQPDQPITCYNLGNTFVERGYITEAQRYFHQAVTLRPAQTLWRLKLDQICPAIMPSSAAIDQWRQEFEEVLNRYPIAGIDLSQQLPDLTAANIFPPFQSPYHGHDERAIKEKYARLFARPNTFQPQVRNFGSKYQIGILVTRNHEGIFINLMRGLINNLPAADLDVTIICSAVSLNRLKDVINQPAVRFLTIPDELAPAIQKIQAQNFDLIYYWEVGSDALNYFLPFFRLAAVQCTSWGLSVTTGVPEMDYFISSQLLEAEGVESHYSERLVKFKTLPTYFYRPTLPSPLKPRSYFGLDQNVHLYLCPQNLLKFHPDFDPILGEILRRDPAGRLVLLQTRTPRLNDDLQHRFQQTIADVVDRICWLPPLEFSDFMNLIAISEVMLDTIHYSGGNTTHEALATGIPVVTMPSSFLRGRLTLGRYLKMGVLDCVVSSPEEYVDKAIQLGTDSNYRETVRAKILAANHVLYEDIESVREFQQFFRQAIDLARSAN